MKLIIAYVQPNKLEDVKRELSRAEVYKMSVIEAHGCGQQRGYQETYRGARTEVNLLKKTRLEIAVNEKYAERTIEAIVAGAQTGRIGDGKIFVLDLGDCVRIRTAERGHDAIG